MSIVGISGLAGSGKDTLGAMLREYGFETIAFADPMKRFCMEIFDFTEDQCWGPSECRNAPDPRYIRVNGGPLSIGDGIVHLTPRFALQTLGTEFGRRCYEAVWVEYALRLAKKLDGSCGQTYDRARGIVEQPLFSVPCPGVAITDVRFRDEVEAVKAAGGKVIRIVRPGAGLSGAAGIHPSETEMASIPDSAFDVVLDNSGTLADFHAQVPGLLAILNGS